MRWQRASQRVSPGCNKDRHPVSHKWPLLLRCRLVDCRHLGDLKGLRYFCPLAQVGSCESSQSSLDCFQHFRRNACFVCQQGLHMHQHMLPLIDKTPSEAALTFASCLPISEPISHHIVPSITWVAISLSLHSPTRPLFPLFQLQSLPLLSAHTASSSTRVRPHRHTNLFTCLCLHVDSRLPSSPLSLVLPFGPHCESSHQQQCFPKGVGYSPISGTNKRQSCCQKQTLGERQQDGDSSVFTLASHGSKWKHILRAFPSWCSPDAPRPSWPTAFRFYMCSLVSSGLYILKQAFTAVLLTTVPGDIFKFILVA